ncbi:MAG: hypothetical protein AB9861_12310 [Methanosarcina sp.]
MINEADSFNPIKIDAETRKHMPKSLQLMIEIEERAQLKFNQILIDILEGRTTLEEVKRQRGLL